MIACKCLVNAHPFICTRIREKKSTEFEMEIEVITFSFEVVYFPTDL